MKIKILIVGSDARAHALAWKCSQSKNVTMVFVAPGNPGMGKGELWMRNVPIGVTELQKLLEFAEAEKVDFTVVSPEGPLDAGIVDLFQNAGQKIFGPTKMAAQLETSKSYAKDFMARHGIPTADFRVFTEAEKAHAYVEEHGVPIVIKADGLAAGKGVVVALTLEEAHGAINALMIEESMGDAGLKVVIEDCLVGEEASFIVMVDAEGNVLPLATSQDHKRLLAGDSGPNTGGMGAYSPAPVVTDVVHTATMRDIVWPTVCGMSKEGNPYVGFLYVGLMIDSKGKPKVVEFNCRLGDPEAEPIMMRLKSDLADIFKRALSGTLDTVDAKWDERAALGVILASAGYPDSAALKDGVVIHGLPYSTEDSCVFCAGIKESADGALVTKGGRVVCVTALGKGIADARVRAYQVASQISFDGMQYRRDIGHRAI